MEDYYDPYNVEGCPAFADAKRKLRLDHATPYRYTPHRNSPHYTAPLKKICYCSTTATSLIHPQLLTSNPIHPYTLKNGAGVCGLSDVTHSDDVLVRDQLGKGRGLHGELSFDLPEGECLNVICSIGSPCSEILKVFKPLYTKFVRTKMRPKVGTKIEL